jgi:hypothetical protein
MKVTRMSGQDRKKLGTYELYNTVLQTASPITIFLIIEMLI